MSTTSTWPAAKIPAASVTAFARPQARVGRQPDPFGGAPVWVVPNPSGLNKHASLADLASAYREVATAAGIELFPGSA
ncbi:hypothetical protein [Arthrobacter sp. ISL-28]|uniref:hypothetical protein n=1 Tax=Arthrobacter sp. ISL-28 TaxID=2819108 RepID=UPI001BE7F568|nr:hypothetical protein [Arthrobacter sp. ISL-28]MBT2520005.1 hypothetical protein [Arthrobacter sp. ISL-28]